MDGDDFFLSVPQFEPLNLGKDRDFCIGSSAREAIFFSASIWEWHSYVRSKTAKSYEWRFCQIIGAPSPKI